MLRTYNSGSIASPIENAIAPRALNALKVSEKEFSCKLQLIDSLPICLPTRRKGSSIDYYINEFRKMIKM